MRIGTSTAALVNTLAQLTGNDAKYSWLTFFPEDPTENDAIDNNALLLQKIEALNIAFGGLDLRDNTDLS